MDLLSNVVSFVREQQQHIHIFVGCINEADGGWNKTKMWKITQNFCRWKTSVTLGLNVIKPNKTLERNVNYLAYDIRKMLTEVRS